jgi:hypothetical protein
MAAGSLALPRTGRKDSAGDQGRPRGDQLGRCDKRVLGLSMAPQLYSFHFGSFRRIFNSAWNLGSRYCLRRTRVDGLSRTNRRQAGQPGALGSRLGAPRASPFRARTRPRRFDRPRILERRSPAGRGRQRHPRRDAAERLRAVRHPRALIHNSAGHGTFVRKGMSGSAGNLRPGRRGRRQRSGYCPFTGIVGDKRTGRACGL